MDRMLRSLNKILGSSIMATDGEIGSVHNFLFEDVSWKIAYLVAETGAWFNRHRVLLSPSVLGHPDWTRKVLPVSLTREQVKSSPDIDTDQPVSRQQEIALSGYYGWPSYWDVPAEPKESLISGDPHLRSCRELMGYRVTAGSEDLGEVEDLIVDDRSWAIRYVMTRAGIESGGQILLLPAEDAREISWTYRRVDWNSAIADL
jgi:hypothetical protein